jgi:hypothetical protein
VKAPDSDVHVLPTGDLRKHEETRACWCDPHVEQADGGIVVVHHSMDGRELVERHGLQ